MTGLKPSGLGWTDAVPKHWDVGKLCMVARLESGHTPSRLHPEYWTPSECTIPWFGLADVWQLRSGVQEYLGETKEKISPRGMANSAARLLPAGTVVLSRTASVGFSGIMSRPMATTQDFANWICGRRLRPEYLLYVLRAMSEEFRKATMGSTHQTIYMPDIRRLAVPIPPLEEQDSIVNTLRSRLPRIDALIVQKERLIELLQEKRQTLITQTVTNGLNPQASTIETSAPWHRRIPRHWSVKKASHIFARIGSGTTPESQNAAYYGGDIPWVTTSELREVPIRATQRTVTRKALAECSALRLFPSGTILVAMYGATIGRIGLLEVPATMNQACCGFVGGAHLRPRYFFFWLQAFRDRIISLGTGGGQPNISQEKLRSLRIGVPPLTEQDDIIAMLDRACSRMRQLEDQLADSVEMLREYRQALITAAVTGKIDVTNEAA